jgi:hypothetical protein
MPCKNGDDLPVSSGMNALIMHLINPILPSLGIAEDYPFNPRKRTERTLFWN